MLLGSGLADTNSVGTLNGVVYTGTGSARFIRGDGSAIQMGEGADILTNYGIITGNTGRAVNLEGGADTMNVMAGSSISGLVDGGAGNDTLNYNKVGLTEAKRAALQAGQTVNIGGTLYTSFETVTGAAVPFSTFGNSGATAGIANLLDNGSNTTGSSAGVVALIDAAASSSNVNGALSQLTPSAYQGASRMTLDSTTQTTSMIDQRLTQDRSGMGSNFTGANGAMAMFDAGLFDNRPRTVEQSFNAMVGVPDGGDVDQALAYSPVYKAPPRLAVVAEPDRGLFVSSSLKFSRTDAGADAPQTRATTANVLGGGDWRFSDRSLVGVFGGYSSTRGDLDAVGSRTRIGTSTIGGYYSYDAPTWFASVTGLYGWSKYDNTRIALGTANLSNFNGTHYSVRGRAGTDLVYGGWTITPEASLQYTRVNVDAFTETGSPAALNVAADHGDSLRSTLAMRFAREFHINGGVLTPEFRLGWMHEFQSGVRGVNANFVDPTLLGTFTTITGLNVRDQALLGTGVTTAIGQWTTVSANYDAAVGNNAVAHQFMGQLKHRF